MFASFACGDSSGTGTETTITGASASTPTTGDTTGPAAASSDTTSTPTTTGSETPTTSTTTGSSGEPGTGAEASEASTTQATTMSGEASTTGAAVDTSSEGTSTTDAAVCGDGIVDPGETCDDGMGVGCDSYHDGGDGVCRPPGECSPGYVLSDENCVAELATDHVHIMVDNTCKMTVMPAEFTVPAGQKLRLDYHNHSKDYPVDVWMQYNGGFTDLAPGATWSEKYEHCFGPAPSEGWAEISTACSMVVVPIHCL